LFKFATKIYILRYLNHTFYVLFPSEASVFNRFRLDLSFQKENESLSL